MKIQDYVEQARSTRTKSASEMKCNYPMLGVIGEFGEVAEKVKKYYRDGTSDEVLKEQLTLELGDVLWYLSSLMDDLGTPLYELVKVDSFEELHTAFMEALREQEESPDFRPSELDEMIMEASVFVGRMAESVLGKDDEDFTKSFLYEPPSNYVGYLVCVLSNICDRVGLTLGDIASANVAKLSSRKDRNVIHGSGDNR